MEQFIRYIDRELPPQDSNKLVYKFKRSVLEEMNMRYGEVMKRGITNTKVITDLVISEYPDLKTDFEKFCTEYNAKDRAKRKLILNTAGSLLYIVCLIITYLGISFATQMWSHTWLIIADGILIWVVYILHIIMQKVLTLKKIFHVFARLLLAGQLMISFVAVFLFVLRFTGNPLSWLIVIAGVAAMFVGDAVFLAVSKRKLAIMNILLYIPVVATMLYIILSAASLLAWNTGWMLIIFSLLLDFLIITLKIGSNKKHKQEVIDTWQES